MNELTTRPDPAPPAARGEVEHLIAKAIEHQVPIETMERLLAMRKELKAEQAKESFYRALSGFQAACPIIPKTKTAEVLSRSGGSYRYSYAPLDGIVKVIAPLLQQFGLSFTVQTRLEQEPLSQVAVCTVHHVDGHSESSEFRAPIDQGARMNEMQKAASAQTYAKRYALCNALGILTGDEDDDAQAVSDSRPPPPGADSRSGSSPGAHQPTADTRPITDGQIRRLFALGRTAGLTPEQIKAGLLRRGIEDIGSMTRSSYDKVCAEIESRGRARTDGEPMAQTPDPQSPFPNALPGDVATLSEARTHGWDGRTESLPDLAASLHRKAAELRLSASRADNWQSRRSAEEAAQRLGDLAGRLVNLAGRMGD